MKAPDFRLKDKDGNVHELKNIKNDFIVLYFYPKDDTPGCTIEAIDFTKNLPAFKRLKTSVIGISGGDEKTKTKFCMKHKLKVILLSDPDFSVAKKYKSYGQKTFMGRKYMGIFRNTFILDKRHDIIKKFEKVNPVNHAKEVITFIKAQK